jgi:glycosyltransferase involved in cell wall biosynthesis
MKILYLANVRIPTEKAHGLQIMKTCEAFAIMGHTVELLVPQRRTVIDTDPFVYYGVKKIFTIRTLASFDHDWGGDRISFFLQYASFSFSALFSTSVRSADLVYGRDELALLAASLVTHTPVMWESHTGAWNLVARLLIGRLRKLVVISRGLKDFYVSRGVAADRISVAADAVDLDAFASPINKEESRTRLGLPMDKKIALYIGRLDGWKGVDVLCESAALMPDVMTVLIGGEEEQVKTLKEKYPNVTFLGFHPYRELANNQAAADVLVLPNSSRSEISSRFTSPLKLFTYMASGIPIIASDLPSIREVVDDRMVFFVRPDDTRALSDTITKVLQDPHAASRALAAREQANSFTWTARSKIILSTHH